ncbi:MAG: succinyl-diaminopimelate desuccinylase [Rhodobiaceae bacterium]|nr:succinyl-diaminopimelate desuccinylase [Rhodobiaceae bacterium]
MSQSLDPVELAAQLIRCPSVTPAEAGALDLLQEVLQELGFVCARLPFQEDGTEAVDNLYARRGSDGPHICFAGHTDVVPVGNTDDWQTDPFAGDIREQALWGRGAADMKGAIAAFVAAVAAHQQAQGDVNGSISFLITGDEEGPSINGTRKMLGWLQEQGEIIDDCLVGEPTNPDVLGDMIKIGRRGSVNGVVTVNGTQGHVAYPHLADNPVPQLVTLMAHLVASPLDDGSEHFQPSNLEITSVDVGNGATNVIPAQAVGRFNIRYNDHWDKDKISSWIEARLDEAAGEAGYALELSHTGDCFLTEPGPFVETLSTAIEEVTGRAPILSTSGGTSDARFIKDITRVVEFGLVGKTMHKVDEHVPVDDIRQLAKIYEKLLAGYFA